MSTPAIRIEELSVRFGEVVALDAVTAEVAEGVTVALLGPSGSGKTTLMRAVLGLLRPQRGAVEVLGERMPSAAVYPHLGYMAQRSGLYDVLSVRENIEFFAGMYRDVGPPAVDAVLELIELAERADSPVSTLSGGMRQRTALAAALVHRPRLLLLDEPTVGLDPRLRARFWDEFRRLNAEGVTILMTSHVMDEAEHADRLIMIVGGRVVAADTPTAIVQATGARTMQEAFLTLAEGEELR